MYGKNYCDMHKVKQSNFVIYRVKYYIKYGWDCYLVDPDRGVNCQRKLAGTQSSQSVSLNLLQSIPDAKDSRWTSRLYDLPNITFSTIYEHLVDRKMLLHKVSYLEGIADKRAETVQHPDELTASSIESNTVPMEYTRTLDKAYRFFQDGHVQNIKYHPMPEIPDHVCVTANALPSMRKDRIYSVTILILESTARVVKAYCACPAGLSGCCNHLTATLYCLEDYTRSGLQDDERKGCTERLQTWNQPRKLHVDPRPTDGVQLAKKEFGIEKRVKKRVKTQN